eukprot:m.105667 g.105667  ORF g.105667 m.105667 type:complete len:424 (-) comp12658_c1_seq3:1976-3247(-)
MLLSSVCLIAVIVLVLLSHTAAATFVEGDLPTPWKETDKSIRHLNDESLQSLLDGKETLFVVFHAQFCEHCGAIHEDVHQLSKTIEKENIDVIVAAFDAVCDEGSKLGNKYVTRGYPTLLLFKDGALPTEFLEERTYDNMLHFIKIQLGLLAEEEANRGEDNSDAFLSSSPDTWREEDDGILHITSSNHDAALSADPSALVLFYGQQCEHCINSKMAFKLAVNELHQQDIPGVLGVVDCSFGDTFDVCDRFNVSVLPYVVYLEDGKEQASFLSKRITPEFIVQLMRNPESVAFLQKVKPWKDREEDPVVHLRGISSEQDASIIRTRQIALVIFYLSWRERDVDEFVATSRTFSDDAEVAFAAVDCFSDPDAVWCDRLKVTTYPTVSLFKFGRFQGVFQGDLTSTNLSNFVVQFKDNNDAHDEL